MKTSLRKFLSFVMVLCFAFICFFGVNVKAAESWELVTDASSLEVGDNIIIAAKDSNYALSTTQNSNNRGQASITKSGNTAVVTSSVEIITLEAGNTSGSFAFKVTSGYLYTGSTSANRLQTTNNVSDKSSWTISISADKTVIQCVGNSSRGTMQYNTSGLFACYSSTNTMAQLVIYKQLGTVEGYKVSYNTNGGNVIDPEQVTTGVATKPADPVKEGYNFVGWYITSTFDEGTEFDFATEITADITLYAKWEEASYKSFIELKTNASLKLAYTSTTSTIDGVKVNTFTKVTSEQADWSGTYLVVYETSNKVFSGVDAANEAITVSISDSAIVCNGEYSEYYVTITKSEDESGYYLKTSNSSKSSEAYFGRTTYSNGVNYSETGIANTISYNAENDCVDIVSSTTGGNMTLKFNNTSGQMRFRYYKSGQQNITLYKLTDSSDESVETTVYDFTSVAMRFGINFSKAMYDTMIAEGATFGVDLTVGENTKSYTCTPVQVNELQEEDTSENGLYYQYAVVINGIDSANYETVIIGQCWVEIDGVKHYMTADSYSVKTLAKAYVDKDDTSSFEEHLGALGDLSK